MGVLPCRSLDMAAGLTSAPSSGEQKSMELTKMAATAAGEAGKDGNVKPPPIDRHTDTLPLPSTSTDTQESIGCMPQGFRNYAEADHTLDTPSAYSATSRRNKSDEDSTEGYILSSTSGEATYRDGAVDDEDDAGSKQAHDPAHYSVPNAGDWTDSAASKQSEEFSTDDVAQEASMNQSQEDHLKIVASTILFVEAFFPTDKPSSGNSVRQSGSVTSSPQTEAGPSSTRGANLSNDAEAAGDNTSGQTAQDNEAGKFST